MDDDFELIRPYQRREFWARLGEDRKRISFSTSFSNAVANVQQVRVEYSKKQKRLKITPTNSEDKLGYKVTWNKGQFILTAQNLLAHGVPLVPGVSYAVEIIDRVVYVNLDQSYEYNGE